MAMSAKPAARGPLRPAATGAYPEILGYGPYGKGRTTNYELRVGPGGQVPLPGHPGREEPIATRPGPKPARGRRRAPDGRDVGATANIRRVLPLWRRGARASHRS
jgi:hypothetical protein